jgi:thymidylate synthase (FAD)
MKTVNAGFEILSDGGIFNVCEDIELAGRTCTKSEDKITFDSGKKFVEKLIASGHESVLEHKTIILKIGFWVWLRILLHNPKFLNLTCCNMRFIVSGNIRALRDFGKTHRFFAGFLSYLATYIPVVFDDFTPVKIRKFQLLFENDLICEEEKLKHHTVSVRIICDRGVSHEIVRHRIASYSQESTRYCNYGKAGEVTFIKPVFFVPGTLSYKVWEQLCVKAEETYLFLLKDGASPQQARSVLPNSLKTEIVVTTNLQQWRHFFELRAIGIFGKPHPQMLEISIPMFKNFIQLYPDIFGYEYETRLLNHARKIFSL